MLSFMMTQVGKFYDTKDGDSGAIHVHVPTIYFVNRAIARDGKSLRKIHISYDSIVYL